ncbi:MAG: hypothetical protein O4808_01995, partial [Trichodesmium sp. St17_bin3_1_1]|nr:hypothetical protein [Trichodesmium sp. St17_bin3_1_1]
ISVSFSLQKVPRSGKSHPEDIAFNEKLQKFSHQLNYIIGLQTAGKISAILAYLQVQELWEELEQVKQKFR